MMGFPLCDDVTRARFRQVSRLNLAHDETMWSRLTEYAEKGIAEIVASADDTSGASQEEDELWTRFTSIVAPPPASASPRQQQEKQQQQKPPLSTSSTRSTRDTDASAGALLAEEEDEQEQYIYELERALLQRKKQNEALEAKVRPSTGEDHPGCGR